MNPVSDLRPSPLAGRWYSSDPLILRQTIAGYLDAARLPELDGRVVGLIAPHAGHQYSGPVAAYAFKVVSGLQVDLVAVLCPMHQYCPYPLATSGHKAYATPLGVIPIDTAAVAEMNLALQPELGFGLSAIFNDSEHSLEIELPFLQCTLEPGFKLLPIMVCDQSPEVAQAVGKALAKTLAGKSALLVASSDLSHYYPRQQARLLDTAILDQVAAFSPQGLFAVEAAGQGQACGLAPMAAVLWAAQGLGADQARVLHYATSGDVTGDHSSVVGYGAAVLLQSSHSHLWVEP